MQTSSTPTERGAARSERPVDGGDTGPAAGRMLRSTVFTGITSCADLLLLVLLILAGRLLGAEDFGRLAFGLAMSTVLVFVVNLGLDSVAIRRIAVTSAESGRVVGSVLGGKLVVVLVALGLYAVLLSVTVDDPLTRDVAYLLGFAGVIRSLNLTLRAFLHGRERFREESAVVLAERLLVLVLGAALLFAGGGLVGFVIVFPIARVCGFFLLLAQVQRFVPRTSWSFDRTLLRSLLRQGLPLGIAIMSVGFYHQIDVLLLTAFLAPSDVGEFASAYRLYEGLLIVPSVLTVVIYPRLAVLAAANEAKFADLFGRAVKYVTVLAAPLIVAGAMLANEIIEILYGTGFEAGADVLRLLAVALGFHFLHAVVDTALRSRSLERAVLRVNLLSLAAKVAVGLLLIPQLGIRGAALAGVAGGAVMLLTGLGALGWAWVPASQVAAVFAKAALGAAAMATCLACALAYLGAPNLLAVMAAALAVYALVMLAARILDTSEWDAVKGLIPVRDRAG